MADSQESPVTAASPAEIIVAAAKSQLGVPYRYGWEMGGEGFDCSGLAQWCCARASIVIPRGSAAQWLASGPRVMAGNPQPGDLAFYYGGETTGPRPGHVGIVVSDGAMIDAPYSGTVVRYDFLQLAQVPGAMDYWGATRPSELLKPPPAPSGPTLCSVQLYVLQVGSSGDAVHALQVLLNACHITELVLDGDFGPLTEAAVKSYQATEQITPDGIVGAETWGRLLGAASTKG